MVSYVVSVRRSLKINAAWFYARCHHRRHHRCRCVLIVVMHSVVIVALHFTVMIVVMDSRRMEQQFIAVKVVI